MTAEKKQKKKPGLFGFFAMPEGEEVTIYRAKHGVDIPFLITVMLLLCFGSVMIFSSSYVFAEKKYGDSFFFIKKQIVRFDRQGYGNEKLSSHAFGEP